MTTVADLIADLAEEHRALDDVVAGLSDDDWHRQTPSPRWNSIDQIAHLTYFDRAAAQAMSDPATYTVHRDELLRRMAAGESLDAIAGDDIPSTPAAALAQWRAARAALLDAASAVDPDARVPWYGPDMGVLSFLTARLMETWAHGQDVVDTVGADRPPTDRLRHIAQLGFITRKWSYLNRGLTPPDVPVSVEVDAPSGERWSWGDPGAAESVRGSAADFCLVVTQRRNVADTDLSVTGDAALEWMSIAQAFAGGVTDPPAPRR